MRNPIQIIYGLKQERQRVKNILLKSKIKFVIKKSLCTFALPFGEVGEWLKPTVC